ncbi:Wzz/FepE/Etk N-terminal domain-containing protein [Jannaschia sp. W003]|uniref:GumC family protein n=1 Tax=Jannaschia sp. W003 TaxID=2867012 RepID=UPI0021A30F4B|nr:Wzz/FepE/Etk N-terminal domain-containing protein [Jannaschia sp. W003]UWQ23213.1 lipopolysaccharide biosynthesis protein [Jannaschia sp. W003]
MADLKFYLFLLLKRLHYVLFFLALGTVTGVTLASILPPVYRAGAQLVVESEQIPDSLAASTVQTRAVEQLQIIERRILTRDNLLDMADRLRVYAGQGSGALQPDEIVSDMRRRITIRIDGGGRRGEAQVTLVNVGFTASRPDMAAAVANEVVTLILQEDVRMRTGVSGQTLEFFEQEVERLNRELEERSAQIVAFQNANKEALPENMEFRRLQLTTLQDRIIQIDRDLAAARQRGDDLTRIYEATGQLGPAVGQPETAEEQELLELQREYRTLSATLSDENPRMRVLRNRIAGLESVIADQQAAALGSDASAGEGADPLSPYEIQMADLAREMEDLAEQRVALAEQVEQLQEAIAATPANAIAIETLRRDYENVRRQYDLAISNRARAETGDMIEALSKGERITVIEQATPPARPVSPDRGRLVTAGVGGGLLAGLALVALLELLNGSVRRPVEISRKMEIMPIGVLPYIRTRGEVRLWRAKIASAFLVVLIAIPVGLWAVHTYYMPIDLLAERLIDRLPIDRLRAGLKSITSGGA